MLYLENVSRGEGGAKLRFQEIREGESGIQLFSVIYAILIDIRLDEFPTGGGASAYNHIHSTYVHFINVSVSKGES